MVIAKKPCSRKEFLYKNFSKWSQTYVSFANYVSKDSDLSLRRIYNQLDTFNTHDYSDFDKILEHNFDKTQKLESNKDDGF